MTSDQQLVLLQSAIALRVQGRSVRESVRIGLASIEAALTAQVGPLVRKRVAARLLDCSVQSLDRWIAKGALPVEPIAEGSTRMAIRTSALIDVAYEQAIEGALTIAAAITAARERHWKTIEIQSACNLISFTTWTAHAAWKKRFA